jgi:hypothetical protein
MRRLFYLFPFCFFISCGDNALPRGVLPKEKMEVVLWDMIQADQYYREYALRDSVKRNVNQVRYELYEKVFQMHKIGRATFDKSYAYYASHPKLMEEVFDSLSVKGSRRLQDFYKPAIQTVDTAAERKIKHRMDSLRPR